MSSQKLSLGELMHDEVFGLFEAMSAIEMMDPKMDVGIISGEDHRIPHTFHSAVEAGILKLDNFTCSELVGIFDSVFSCLVCWLEGHSLDQILFTCLYLHNPVGISCEVLKHFCLAIRKLIPLIKELVIEGNVSEEEDFQLFGISSLSILDYYSEAQVMHLLKQSEDELLRKTKLNKYAEEDLAIMNRLRLLRFMLQVIFLISFKKNILYDDTVLGEITKQLNAALELMPYIKRTINIGMQPDSECELPNPIGYSPRVNQRNLPPTFPRSTRIRDRLSSFEFIEDLLLKLKTACKIIYQRDYHSTLNFFIEFSKKSYQCLLSRSVLQIIFFRSKSIKLGVNHFEMFLRESIKSFVAPPILFRNNFSDNVEARKYVSSFFNYCINLHTFTYFIQICGHNRARQRDKLARLIEEGFGTLQEEAGRVDSYLNVLSRKTEIPSQHGSHFATWTLYYSLRAMSLFLLSGFELELYSVHEYIYIYWYLYEFLFGFVVSTLSQAESLSTAQEDSVEMYTKVNVKQRKSKIRRKKGKLHLREIMYNHALQMMSGGYYKTLLAFTKEGRINQPKSKFDFQEIRFKHRFAPFRNLINPPPMTYNDFIKALSNHSRLTVPELFLAAANHFHQARAILESIINTDQEIVQIIQVAKINFVVTSLLANGHKKDSKLQPDFDFSVNIYFPIIKIN